MLGQGTAEPFLGSGQILLSGRKSELPVTQGRILGTKEEGRGKNLKGFPTWS